MMCRGIDVFTTLVCTYMCRYLVCRGRHVDEASPGTGRRAISAAGVSPTGGPEPEAGSRKPEAGPRTPGLGWVLLPNREGAPPPSSLFAVEQQYTRE